jgi:SAM-dependent methyltransferase
MTVVFDQLRWRDPVSGLPLETLVTARTPAGVPICGALRVPGARYGYPIVDCVARLTPALAETYRDWLLPFDLVPPPGSDRGDARFQSESTVESFGFQWAWNSEMRSAKDLLWRTAERFRIRPAEFAGQLILDAGSGAGDQSRWMIGQGACVLSLDLSSAIGVVASKLRQVPGWFGVQGDITALPLMDDQFDLVYCEGVIQHTRDSALAVRELCRSLRPGGRILATHYGKSERLLGRIKLGLVKAVRARLSRLDRYRLLLLTGNIAALSSVPLLGRLLRLSGIAVYYRVMPDFKTTWTNTFDNYGNHQFQRYIGSDEFWSYFSDAGGMERVFSEGTLVVARKTGQPGTTRVPALHP